jgi:hypothetical protein
MNSRALAIADNEETMSIVDQLKALDEQRAKLIESAKDAALKKAHEAIAELGALGFHHRLVEGAATARGTKAPKEKTGEPKRQQKDIPCPICNFKTNPLHDRRTHRTQEPKRPYTAEELAAKGLARVK